MSALKPVGSKVPPEQHEQLRWLSYKQHTTISALIARYVAAGLKDEDLSDMPAEVPRQ